VLDHTRLKVRAVADREIPRSSHTDTATRHASRLSLFSTGVDGEKRATSAVLAAREIDRSKTPRRLGGETKRLAVSAPDRAGVSITRRGVARSAPDLVGPAGSQTHAHVTSRAARAVTRRMIERPKSNSVETGGLAPTVMNDRHLLHFLHAGPRGGSGPRRHRGGFGQRGSAGVTSMRCCERLKGYASSRLGVSEREIAGGNGASRRQGGRYARTDDSSQRSRPIRRTRQSHGSWTRYRPMRRRVGAKGSALLINRETGEGLSFTLWDDEAAMDASEERANELRSSSTEQTGTEVTRVGRFEVVHLDMD